MPAAVVGGSPARRVDGRARPRGGVLIVDDYGHWQGSRRAVDEYFVEHGIHMLFAHTDYTGRMGLKP